MKLLIRNFMAEECKKLVTRHFDYLYQLNEDAVRAGKRLDTPIAKQIHVPPYWRLDPRFNPFKIRKNRVLDRYSEILDRRIANRTYKPRPAVNHYVLKEDGTKRETNVYQIPDSAVSRLIYKSLLHKNLNRFSAYAYAYREDRGAHDAVQAIFGEWRTVDRLYVAEFDFTKFFDNIDHNYLWRVIDRYSFICSPAERGVLEAFLASEVAGSLDYKNGIFKARKRGIPQGTSISLFLANLACWELDRALERIGVGFARYADDTLIWSDNYGKVVQAYDAIRQYSEIMQVPINFAKSHGINLLTRNSRGELTHKESVDFVGYRISPASIAIKDGRIKKLKAKLSYIAYQNLLQPPKKGIFNTKRLDVIDWDYLVTVSQIRRYLYGGLNDEQLRRYIRGQIPKLNFVGLMSYYPLANDQAQLALLDGWLIYMLKQCLKKREAMWEAAKSMTLPGPTSSWIQDLTALKTWTSPTGTKYDLRIPSFALINKAMSAAIVKSGISAATNPASVYY